MFDHFQFALIHGPDIPGSYGEGNGTPLQCSCLENPRNRGAWWAAVYGIAQSRTRLKRLSSSSSSMPYCSLQHRTLLLSPVTSTTGYCFCFGSIPSLFLELFHWSPVACWVPTDLGSSSFSVLSFCLFILFMGFSRQEYWSGLPFPSPVDHIRLIKCVCKNSKIIKLNPAVY